jgi:hypothetical protein
MDNPQITVNPRMWDACVALFAAAVAVLVILLGATAYRLAGAVATWSDQADRPVCHAVTEDSVISDCVYQHGAWRPIVAR